MSKAKSEYLVFTVSEGSKGLVANLYSPPNAGRRDWEFGKESRVEVLTTVLNSLGGDGWQLANVDEADGDQAYVLSR